MQFLEFMKKDWSDYFLKTISLKMYEKEQAEKRKKISCEKNRITRNNRIIVKVNEETIYDSKDKSKELSDELYFALLSYGLKESIRNKPNKKTPIKYNITPKITSAPTFTNINIREAISGGAMQELA